MRPKAVFILDSSYPSVDVALPIDDKRRHIVVSNRRIEPPPGHSGLQLDEESNFTSILANLRSLRAAWAEMEGGTSIVIAAPSVRPEQLLLNSIYSLSLGRDIRFFDGLICQPMLHAWRRLLKATIVGSARCVLGGLRLRLMTALFDRRVRTFSGASTPEGRLFGLFTSSRSFSLPPDKVTFREDGKSLYGDHSCGWYLPAFSGRRQRYSVQTSRHRMRGVSLHVEEIDNSEVSSVFVDGRILDYPYFLGKARHRFKYPVSRRLGIKTADRGICLLAYTSGYYHWLLEGIPRVLDLLDDGFDFDEYPLILPPLAPFQRQTLEVLGIDPDRQVITVDIGEWCHVDHCVLPTANFPFGARELEDPSGQPDRALLLRIRDRLMERLVSTDSVDTQAPRKLYISRAKARTRKFNAETESAVTSILGLAGFERVCLEDLTWPAQVHLLAKAEFIVGLHGAGLANILFANAKALLEFHNPLEARPYFAVMARELDIRYTYIIGSLVGDSPTFDNIAIDLDVVERMVERLAEINLERQ